MTEAGSCVDMQQHHLDIFFASFILFSPRHLSHIFSSLLLYHDWLPGMQGRNVLPRCERNDLSLLLTRPASHSLMRRVILRRLPRHLEVLL